MRSKEDTTAIEDITSRTVMGKLINEFDWSKTLIGPREKWPENLKSLVNMMLANRFPMLLWWGEHYVQIYNDPYIPVLGLKHPSPGLGRPGYECWAEIWPVIGPLVDTPFKGGPATWMDDILLMVNRNNFIEETHFTIAYSPIPDPLAHNGIGGVLATVNEITREIIGKRQIETLGRLGKSISSTSSVAEVYSQTVNALQANSFDIPFAFIHTIGPEKKARLAAAAGIEISHPQLPAEIDLTDDGSIWQDLARCAKESTLVIAGNGHIKTNGPRGPWDSAPAQFAYLPVREAQRGAPVAVLTLALNPYRKFDESYDNFVQLIDDQVSSGVTNIMAYEKEKQRAEALTELDKAKTIFFGNVSHEFRTPLTLMLGPLDDLLSQKNHKIEADREVIALIQRNGLRLQKLVNTLLDFSRIEAGRMQMVFKPTDLSKLTRDLASNFTSAMAKAGLQLEVDCPALPEPVFVDEEMWEKIVLNLLSNAFKFTFEGKVIVRLRMLADAAELTITDTGIGISHEDRQRIFERFHRVSRARSRSFEGSGIGLALVNELVKLHGGSIGVESEPGEGTSFTVHVPRGRTHLPADQVRPSAQRDLSTAIKANAFLEEAIRWFPEKVKQIDIPHLEAKQPTGKPSVILADDNADMREYIKGILDEYCDVYAVGDGKEAFELAKAIKPDLILSDVMMPEMDGFELLERLRRDPLLKPTPVILLSARAGQEARVEGFHAGADDYLTKPFTRNELLARVSSNIQLSKVRKKIEEAIRQSESRLRALVIATSDVVYRMSADWKVMRQLDGRDFLQDTGEPLSNWQEKYIHPKDRDRVWAEIREAIRTKSVFQLEHQVIRADGTLGWTFSRAVPILDRQGEIIEWFGAASDVSDRKQYEMELERRVEERTKQLNSANTALKISNNDLEQFAHVASHDLKEPVRKIKTFANRLLDDEGIPNSEKGQKYISKILTSAERMSTMIDGVLTYSYLNGADSTKPEAVDLGEVLEEIKTDLELLIQQKHAAILHTGLPVIVGQRLLLYQVFYNLVSNSLKFSHLGRDPVIAIGSHLEETGGTKRHVITVKDNGIGFDADFNELIFETFYRLNAKEKFDGTGLGLSLCRKIVERHHGFISAKGEKGVGAVFTIELPAA